MSNVAEHLAGANIRHHVLNYVRMLQASDDSDFVCRYALSCAKPVLYASIYSAMLRHMLGDLEFLPEERRVRWIEYINSFQGKDGLYRDPALQNEVAETEDWWGWRHLTAHAVTALTVLGGKLERPFAILEPLFGEGNARRWISGLDWQDDAANTSNRVMNYGVMLQYDRDFQGIVEAGEALDEVYDWLDEHQDPGTGLWGNGSYSTPKDLSIGVQTAYHLWILYFYDSRSVGYVERAIDSCLNTQNETGGFAATINSSACEDIDTIDPLCRLYFLTNYRRNEIRKTLLRALPWILANQNRDGGFVFQRCGRFVYGHELMTSGEGGSNMFATWFRTLSLAYIAKVFPDHEAFQDLQFKLCNCPGYQFWNIESED